MELTWLTEELSIEERETPGLPFFSVIIRHMETLKKIEGYINQRTNFLVRVDPKDFGRLHDYLTTKHKCVYADVDFYRYAGSPQQGYLVERVWCTLVKDPDELSIEFEENVRRFSGE